MMKIFRKMAVFALLSCLVLSSVQAQGQRAKINPVKPKTLRLPGESRQDLMKRITDRQKRRDPFEKRKAAQEHMNRHAKSLEQFQNRFAVKPSEEQSRHFENFKGWWILSSIDDWSSITLIEFFEEDDFHFAKFYDGTQNAIRERNQNDEDNEFVAPTSDGVVVFVEVLGQDSLRFLNWLPHLSTDDLRSTFRIQSYDEDLAYMVLWSPWDGAADSPDYGINETLTQYKRLEEKPCIQSNDRRSKIDWNNPVELFSYFTDYFALLGQPQKAYSLHQNNYIGSVGYKELAHQLLTTGITRTAKVSTAKRGGSHIGVWRTQFPEDFPITTIHTQELSHMNPCSKITITGFKGAYAELNGTHLAAAFPPASVSISTPSPWQDETSREHFVHILYDSSHIKEEYDPNIHGIANLETQHGPITRCSGYREFMAAVEDFLLTSFGPGTHTRTRLWVDAETLYTVPETFSELREALAKDEVTLLTIRDRTFVDNGFQLYWNPYQLGFPLIFPTFNLNDPFGFGLAELDEQFDYDIVLENYLDRDTVKNIFFTVTGYVNPSDPITGQLEEIGYTSNGSRVVFKANDYQTFPPPLVDDFGKHEWMLYNNADGNEDNVDYASLAFFGGIVKPELTGDSTVAYMRIADESAFDEPFEVLQVRSLGFPQPGISSTYFGNMIAAWASLIEELNKHSPDRFIIDIRNNAGGFAINESFGSLFGGERPAGNKALGFPGNGRKSPLLLTDSGAQTVFNSVSCKPPRLLNNEAAAAFPKGVVRGSKDKKIEVIILTSTNSGSSGDLFPHNFLGPNPEGTVQDLGHNVELRIMGDIDGRLWSGFKAYDAPPLDPLCPDLVDSDGISRTPFYMCSEGGLLFLDRHGYIVNETMATRPNPLLPGWYDQTEWQDLGVTKPVVDYPLGNLKPLPIFECRQTWRDVWLENAIVN